MVNGLSFNSDRSAQRKEALEKYFESNVLTGDQFLCPSFQQCKESHNGLFYEGQLHHVGNHYYVAISGHPYRIMIVGQEYGHGPSLVSMEERSKIVLENTGLQKDFKGRNPHMRGTTSMLRLLYGIPLGNGPSDEFLQVTDEQQCHLFDAFALVNYLLCSAVSEDDGRRGKSTPAMRNNCQKHFRAVIEILEPNVVIVQGKSYWQSIQNAFDGLTKKSETLYQADINQRKVMVAVFCHPSTPDNTHNWGRDDKTPYLLGTVVPTIDTIRKEILGSSSLNGANSMPPISELPKRQIQGQKASSPYDAIFEQIKAGLKQRFSAEINYRKPEFELPKGNRQRIYLDRITGSHYEICFRQNYYEFALHFESSSAMSLARRHVFDHYLSELTRQVGVSIQSGPHENKGWMRVYFEQKREPIVSQKINIYTDLFARFIIATFPILIEIYEKGI